MTEAVVSLLEGEVGEKENALSKRRLAGRGVSSLVTPTPGSVSAERGRLIGRGAVGVGALRRCQYDFIGGQSSTHVLCRRGFDDCFQPGVDEGSQRCWRGHGNAGWGVKVGKAAVSSERSS